MDTFYPLRLLPTMQMLHESMEHAGWECRAILSDEKRHYRGVRLYHSKQALQKDVLYLLRPTETEFPFDDYSYISVVNHPGKANHMVCPGHPDEEILDQLLEVFSQFRGWEESVDLLLHRNASLQELCELGARITGKPVCIHDDWFVMMAMTAEYSQLMEPEYWTASTRGFVPRAVIEDFQNDSDYLETYTYHDAQIWFHAPGRESMYVNLWDGAVYKGRLLIARQEKEFLHRDFLLAEVIAQRAVMLLQRKQPGDGSGNMDAIVYDLLRGRQPEGVDLSHLMDMLSWQKTDQFLCIRLKPQQRENPTLAERMLHSDLFRSFPGSYVLLGSPEQILIWNLTRSPATTAQVRHRLAPLCRDYCLYAGISSPVTGIRELNAGYYQSGVALEQAFRLRSDRWILPFADCALDHIAATLPHPLIPGHLVSPELLQLREYDRENGTLYFETLREFILQERDIPRTSAALIIHRTTLLYRLKKIRALVDLDLEDPWRRLQLMLSLWILEGEQT